MTEPAARLATELAALCIGIAILGAIFHVVIGLFVTTIGLMVWTHSENTYDHHKAARWALLGFAWPVLLITYAITAVPALIRDATRNPSEL